MMDIHLLEYSSQVTSTPTQSSELAIIPFSRRGIAGSRPGFGRVWMDWERKGKEGGDGSWDVIWVEQIGAAGKQGLMGLGLGVLAFGDSFVIGFDVGEYIHSFIHS